MIAKEKSQSGASIVKPGRLRMNSVNNQSLEKGTNITFGRLETLLHIATYSEMKIIQKDLAFFLHKNKSRAL